MATPAEPPKAEEMSSTTGQYYSSTSQQPSSQTASDFIDSQLQLEAEAREALPYSFDHCTRPLGPLRQNVFSCITCNPPPASPEDPYNPAGICYGCSIACHGEHTLVELFARRDFTCDCGTTKIESKSPCTLRIDPVSKIKGPVHSEAASASNIYNKNFRNRFCGCGDLYDAHAQKGTMYQCLGLASESQGGCGEDWWHPECLMGLPRNWYDLKNNAKEDENSATETVKDEKEHPVPSGFPDEERIESLICYKCVEVVSWIKQYAGTKGFLPPLIHGSSSENRDSRSADAALENADCQSTGSRGSDHSEEPTAKKRKAGPAEDDETLSKKIKSDAEDQRTTAKAESATNACRRDQLPPAQTGVFSIIATEETFRTRFCRCAKCYPLMSKLPQLLEEEVVYEPPLSEDGDDEEGGGSMGTGSLLERGEAALSNVDRVRAIEGVMVYNHLKDKVKSFLQPFAESGQAVGAEDIKAYFEKLRGDHEAINAAGGAAVASGDGDGHRREQSGY